MAVLSYINQATVEIISFPNQNSMDVISTLKHDIMILHFEPEIPAYECEISTKCVLLTNHLLFDLEEILTVHNCFYNVSK